MFLNFLLVAIGGSVGAMLRYSLSQWLVSTTGHFPWGTLVANLTGCLLMGVLLGTGVQRNLETSWLLLGVGVLGSLTTWSTFSGETLQLWINHHNGLAIASLLANLVGSLTACAIGFWLVCRHSG